MWSQLQEVTDNRLMRKLFILIAIGLSLTSASYAEVRSSAAQWRDEGSNFTFGSPTADDIETQVADRGLSVTDSNLMYGDFDYVTTFGTNTTDWLTMVVYAKAEDATFNPGVAYGATTSMTNSFSCRANGVLRWGATIVGGTITMNTTSPITIRRRGATISILQDASTQHTWTQRFDGPIRIALASGNSGQFFNNVYWIDYGAGGKFLQVFE